MTDRELMQQALEELDAFGNGHHHPFRKLCAALRERLAQPEFDSALQSAAMTQTAPKLAQPEQYQRPQMRRATREEKIDRPGVYWVPVEPEPVAWQWLDTGTFRKSLPASAEPGAWRPLYTAPQQNTIANSEVIPEQISGPKQEPPNLNCKSVQARLAAQWGYVKAEQEQKRPQNCGTSYCSCIECVMKFEQPEQEPVRGVVIRQGLPMVLYEWEIRPTDQRLFTTPPRREWVGLTDKEIAEAGKLWVEGERMLPFAFANAIEAKLKEKNQ